MSHLAPNSNLREPSTLRPKMPSKWKKFLGTLEAELDDVSENSFSNVPSPLTPVKVRRRASVSTGQASRIVSNDMQWQKVHASLRSKRSSKSGISLTGVLQNVLRERMRSMNGEDVLSDDCVDDRFDEDDEEHYKLPFAAMQTPIGTTTLPKSNIAFRRNSTTAIPER
jgi:hypothetical protein